MSTEEIRRKNCEFVGLIGEKIISNHFSSMGLRTEFNLDPYANYDLSVFENDKKLKVQVKTITPYFKYDLWKIDLSKTAENIINIFTSDKLFILSLPVNNLSRFGFKRHETDGCIIEVDVQKLNDVDNISDQFKAFVIDRTKHTHMYKIVRRFTENELLILQKYPTTSLSI